MESETRKPRRGIHPAFAWAVILFISAAGLMLSALGVEIYLAWRHFDGYAVWPPKMEATVEAKPGLMPGVSGSARFTTNKYGIRARDLSFRDDYRILTVGGSTTECVFLDDTETWSHIVGEILEDSLKSAKVWVGNLGRSGQTTQNHIEVMEQFVPQLKSIDAVFFMVGINDMSLRLSHGDYPPRARKQSNNGGEIRKPTFVKYPEHCGPIYRLSRVRQRLLVLRRKICGCAQPQPADPYTVDADGMQYEKWRIHRRASKKIINTVPDIEEDLEIYRSNLNELIDKARDQGIAILFGTQPTIWQSDMPPHLKRLLWFGGIGKFQEFAGLPYYSEEVLATVIDRYNQALKSVCSERQTEYLDLAAIIPKDTTAFYDDCHLNENGARLVAGAVAGKFLHSDALLKNRRN